MNQPSSSPRPEPVETPEEKKGVGAVVGTIIIILLLAAGAFYFWGARLNGNENPPPYILGNEGANTDSDTQAGLPPQSTSDEPNDIYADVQAMNLEKLENENQNSTQSFSASAQ